MKRPSFIALLIFLVTISSWCTASADITSVIIPVGTESEFNFAPGKSFIFEFATQDVIPVDATIKGCELWLKTKEKSRQDNQDISVRFLKSQVGLLNAYRIGPQDIRGIIKPASVCGFAKDETRLLLESATPDIGGWTFFGPASADPSDRPRLIVTYSSPSMKPASPSGEVTSWRYEKPDSFFNARRWTGGEILSLPVVHGGSVYFLGRPDGDTRVYNYELTNDGRERFWSFPTAASGKALFAPTADGRKFQFASDNTVQSCRGELLNCIPSPDVEKVNFKEPPAMAPDGSLYFRAIYTKDGQQVKAGPIVGYNPVPRRIWSTKELSLSDASPVALTNDGRYAFLLGKASAQGDTLLYRIDTATGAWIREKISCGNSADCKAMFANSPDFTVLKRPTVSTKEPTKGSTDGPTDYVFVAANTSGAGFVRLYYITRGEEPKVQAMDWALTGLVPASPVLGLGETVAYLVIVQKDQQNEQHNKLERLKWFGDGAKVVLDKEKDIEELGDLKAFGELGPEVEVLLTSDAAGTVYFYTERKMAIFRDKMFVVNDSMTEGLKGLSFTSDGTLIGLTDNSVLDLTPKASELAPVDKFSPCTIYSASEVSFAPHPTVASSRNPPSPNEIRCGAAGREAPLLAIRAAKVNLPAGFAWNKNFKLDIRVVGNQKQ
jgi:hypothetical protein